MLSHPASSFSGSGINPAVFLNGRIYPPDKSSAARSAMAIAALS